MSASTGAVVGYAVVSGMVVLAAALGLGLALSPPDAAAVAWAAAVAYVVQVASFAALLASRRGRAFFLAWGGGTVIRLGLVVGAGIWLGRTAAHPPAPLLLSLAGFLFVLLLLEPAFFRRGLRTE